MLNQQTIEKLYAMRMRGMADAFTQQQEEPQTTQLSFEERFALLVDRQWNWRQNRALERRLREGRLQGPACMEDIDFRAARGLDKQVVRSLMNDSDWVAPPSTHFPGGADRNRENVSGEGIWAEGLPRRVHRVLRHCRAVVSGTGTGAGGRQLRQAATRAGASGCADRRRLGDVAAGGSRTSRVPGDLRRTLPDQVDAADQPVAGGEVACADRRPDRGRQHSGSSGACGAPDRPTGRIDAEEEGWSRRRKMPSSGRIAAWFWALTPVALRAPSVSAQNHKSPRRRETPPHQDSENKQKS